MLQVDEAGLRAELTTPHGNTWFLTQECFQLNLGLVKRFMWHTRVLLVHPPVKAEYTGAQPLELVYIQLVMGSKYLVSDLHGENVREAEAVDLMLDFGPLQRPLTVVPAIRLPWRRPSGQQSESSNEEDEHPEQQDGEASRKRDRGSPSSTTPCDKDQNLKKHASFAESAEKLQHRSAVSVAP